MVKLIKQSENWRLNANARVQQVVLDASATKQIWGAQCYAHVIVQIELDMIIDMLVNSIWAVLCQHMNVNVSMSISIYSIITLLSTVKHLFQFNNQGWLWVWGSSTISYSHFIKCSMVGIKTIHKTTLSIFFPFLPRSDILFTFWLISRKTMAHSNHYSPPPVNFYCHFIVLS